MLTVIQAGKPVRVLVALAYRLVLGPADALRWSAVVEKAKALGKVVTELSANQSTEPGRQKQQTCCGETQHLPSDHQVPESSSLGGRKPLLWTHKRVHPFIYEENSTPWVVSTQTSPVTTSDSCHGNHGFTYPVFISQLRWRPFFLSDLSCFGGSEETAEHLTCTAVSPLRLPCR